MPSMRYIRVNTENEALVICQRVFNAANADGKFAPGTTAYAIPEKIEYYTVPILEGFDSYFTNSELSGAEMFAEEKQGRLVYDDLKLQLKQQNLTTTQMLTLSDYIINVIVYMLAGDLRVARLKANNLALTALYTQARKTYLLNQLDAAILKL